MTSEPTLDDRSAAGPHLPFSPGSGFLSSAAAVLLALALCAVLIAFWQVNPLTAYAALFDGAFGSWNSLSETLLRAIPLTLAGLAIAISFRAGTFNIGAEKDSSFSARPARPPSGFGGRTCRLSC